MTARLYRLLALLLLLSAPLPAAAQPQALVLHQGDAVHGVPGHWAPVHLPHDWEDAWPGYSGDAWYRFRFDAPPGDELLALYLERACTNAEVFLNGELVGSGGRMQQPVTRNCYYPQLFPIPRSLLREHGNELQIRLAGYAAQRVAARQRAGGLSAPEVGPLSVMQRVYDRQLFWNVTVAQIISATIAALGLAMLGLAAVRRKDSYLLFFGLFATGWAVIGVRLFIRDVPLGHTAGEILICSAFTPVLACAYLFLLRLVERRYRWFERLLLVRALAVPPLLVLAAPGNLLSAATAVYNLLALEFLFSTLVFFVVAWRERRGEFWLMGGVLLVAIALAGVEIALQNRLLPLPRIHVIHFAMPLIFIVIGIRMIQLFVQALNRAERANEQLEERVAEKSREIEHSWRQITQLRAAEAALDERRRIASDLHDDLGAQLLTIAQASGPTADRERIASLARQALDEMRLSVRGLTAEAAHASDVLADWRAECVSRLDAAGLEPVWLADEPPPAQLLPARVHVQCTRILREAVSNAIRHSGARCCEVRVAFAEGGLRLEVCDDGRGITAPQASSRRGHGLANIERRARALQGWHELAQPERGGTVVRVWVPLAAAATVDAA